MEKQNSYFGNVHPALLIWLGILTGALIATMIFGYHLFELAENYKASFMMSGSI